MLGCDVSEASPRVSEHRGVMIRQLYGRESLKSFQLMTGREPVAGITHLQ